MAVADAVIIDGGYNKRQSNATLYNLDHHAISGNPGGSKGPTSFLINDYSSTAMQTKYQPDTSIILTNDTNSNVNKDALLNNTQTPPEWGNVRFRHKNNTVCNVLFADGHVESEIFKSITVGSTVTYSCTLKRSNVNVNPQ